MNSVAEFLQYADECLRAAAEAKTDEERKAFFDLAKTWAEAAAKITGAQLPAS